MTKKKAAKKVEKVEQRTHLTDIEMLRIENNSLKVELFNTKAALIDKVSRLNAISVEKQSHEVMLELNKAKNERKDYNIKIKDEMGLQSETWGYDPITGEVKS